MFERSGLHRTYFIHFNEFSDFCNRLQKIQAVHSCWMHFIVDFNVIFVDKSFLISFIQRRFQ